jgi:AcrR family transcriptional regulator
MMLGERLEGSRLFTNPLTAAVVEAINERGYVEASVEDILARAGMSREEFDCEFSGKPDLTLRVSEALLGDFRRRVGAAYESEETWPANLRAAGYEAARWLLENPDAMYFGMVRLADAGEMPRVRREETFLWCASLIEDGRAVAADPEAVPPMASLLAIGAVAELLRRQQEGSFEGDTVAVVPQMLYGAVRPYLGEEAALRELEIPPPPDLADGGRRRTDDASSGSGR